MLRHSLRACRRFFPGIRPYSIRSDLSQQSGLPAPRLDYKSICEHAVFKSHNAFNRKANLPVGAIQAIEKLYTERKQIETLLSTKRHTRSIIGDRIRANTKDPQAKQTALDEAKALKAEVADLEARFTSVEDRLLHLALAVPNDTHPLTPLGPEAAAATLSTHGPPPVPASPQRDHVAIGLALGLLDLEAAATVTGSSWYYLLREGALLEIALTNYALAIAMRHGFSPVTTPDVVRADVAWRCGFQPRDPDADPPVSQMYYIQGSSPELVLSGTAEIPLGGLFSNKILLPKDVPTKLVGLGRAFRAEAGASGADTRGLYRVHQFSKLELFVICGSEEGESERMMEEMRNVQVETFEGLGLTFRVLDMPTEELGASAYRKYDMEAWMPGRGSWGEISSTSNCTDYQARRLHIRYRAATPPGSTPEASQTHGVPFAHTLNGTAAAIPRLIVALLENGARFDGEGNVVGLDLPSSLKPFWLGASSGRDIIRWL